MRALQVPSRVAFKREHARVVEGVVTRSLERSAYLTAPIPTARATRSRSSIRRSWFLSAGGGKSSVAKDRLAVGHWSSLPNRTFVQRNGTGTVIRTSSILEGPDERH